MIFFNLLFLFLFSLIPLPIVSSEGPSSANQSRHNSPAVDIRNANLWYEFPGSNLVYYEDPGKTPSTYVAGKNPSPRASRHSAPSSSELERKALTSISDPAESLVEVKSSSLPDESKLAAALKAEVLSNSTERFDFLKNQIDNDSASTLQKLAQFISQKLKISSENPNK